MTILTLIADVVSAVCLLGGMAMTLLAAVGFTRFPDVLMRLHAQTKPATFGMLLMLLGVALHVRSLGMTGTLVLVAALQVLTAPVGAHMLGRSAYRAGIGRERLIRDDLQDSPPPTRDRAEDARESGSP